METYYNPEDLAKFGTIGEKASELSEKFFAYYNAVFEEGALTAREKSLIALAVAHTVQCPYCIDAVSYTHLIALIQKSHEGDDEARAQLVEENTGLVWCIVRRFAGRGTEMEDLFQICLLYTS